MIRGVGRYSTLITPIAGSLFHAEFQAGCTRGRARDLTGFLATRPKPLPCSKTPAEPARPHR
jgi:hypothetical protein